MNNTQTFILVLLISISTSFAQTNYYVATTGDNSNFGSENSPFRTIAKAINSFDFSGGICFIKEGTYHESLAIDGKNNITIQPYNNDIVIIDGTDEIGRASCRERV